jgi:DNA-binding beta-propeller fold protein YncE
MRYLATLALALTCCTPAPSAPRPSSLASAAPPPSAPAAPASATAPSIESIPLPGGDKGVLLDYLAVDRAAGRVWIPAGGTASVDVLDAQTNAVTRIEGFATAEAEVFGKKVMIGPSAVTIGEGVVYVGNRGDGSICAIDAASKTKLSCYAFGTGGLASTPDGLAYVATTRELWVTVGAPPLKVAPPEKAIVVLDASQPKTLAPKGKVVVDGEPEGYAVDARRGVFYTNFADTNVTAAIDVRKREVIGRWHPGCGGDGPRGLALDSERRWLFVACTNGVVVLDAADGHVLARAEAGDGVDNIDYVEGLRLLYVASGKDAQLRVLRMDGSALTLVATVPTAPGTRVVVADASGRAYVADSRGGRILAVRVAR